MALEEYLNKRTDKADMLNKLKTKGMDEQRLERLAQKTALAWRDLKECAPMLNEVQKR